MAKKLLLDALVSVLGEYIELNESNLDLTLAVWSGQLKLQNLKLKTNKLLKKFNINILYASISSLEIIIPWTALLNSPVKIHIDGVYIQVSPLKSDELDHETAKNHTRMKKQEQLIKADKLFENNQSTNIDSTDTNTDSGPSTQTLLQFWTSKIVDNIEIQIKNIHLRYEDNYSIPGIIVSAGLSLSSFSVCSCDQYWQEKFVSRNANDIKFIIHKLVKIQNIGIYWNTSTKGTYPVEYDDWLEAMLAEVHSQPFTLINSESDSGSVGVSVSDTTEYILYPNNILDLKFKHYDGKRSANDPKYDISIQSTHLNFAFDRVQYSQTMHTIDLFKRLQHIKQPLNARPSRRPCGYSSSVSKNTTSNIPQWWRYAVLLVTKRKRYKALFKLSKVFNASTGLYEDRRSTLEKEETLGIEDLLPLNNLVIFRREVALEMQRERRLASTPASPVTAWKDSGGSGKPSRTHDLTVDVPGPAPSLTNNAITSYLASWLFVQPPRDVDESSDEGSDGDDDSPTKPTGVSKDALAKDDVPLEKILAMLDTDSTLAVEHPQGENDLLYALQLSTGATLTLSLRGEPIALASLASVFSASMTVGQHVVAECALSSLSIEDKCTPSPNISHIIHVKNTEKGHNSDRPLFSMNLDLTPTQASVKIHALPLEIVLNKLCINSLLLFATLPRRAQPSPASPSTTALAPRVRAPYIPSRRFAFVTSQVLSAAKPFINRKMSNASPSLPLSPLPPLVHPDAVTSSLPSPQLDTSAPSTFTLLIALEAHAPKIIIPEDSTVDRNYLLLDAGFLTLSGSIGSSGVSLDVKLSDVNAGLPTSVKNIYSLASGEQSLYLIKVIMPTHICAHYTSCAYVILIFMSLPHQPFEIALQFEANGKHASGAHAKVAISPGVCGELSSDKLKRLLGAFCTTSASVTPTNIFISHWYTLIVYHRCHQRDLAHIQCRSQAG